MTGQSSYRLYSDLLYSLFNWFSGFLNVYGLFYLNLPEEGTLVFSDPTNRKHICLLSLCSLTWIKNIVFHVLCQVNLNRKVLINNYHFNFKTEFML